MATLEKVAASTNGERERSISQLADINGIARKTAEAMYEMGIRGYADLAQYLSQRTAPQVSAALKKHGVNRPPAFIDQETWARQARAYGELDKDVPTLPDEEPVAGEEVAPSGDHTRGHDAGFTVCFDVATDGDREPELRTTVRDTTNGDQQGVFQGKDTAPWVNWILERAMLPSSLELTETLDGSCSEQPHTEAVAPPVAVQPGDAWLEIGEVQVTELGSASDVQGKRLRAEIGFRLSGSGAETLAWKGLSFRVEGYTVDTETGLSELVACDRGRLVPQVFEYRGQQEFRMPEVGCYEFYSLVLLLPPGELAAYRRGPRIQIVP